VSAEEPPENGRSMAASEHASGNQQFPGAEALDMVELLHRNNHATFHLSYYYLQCFELFLRSLLRSLYTRG
jgi:hypothetical protein